MILEVEAHGEVRHALDAVLRQLLLRPDPRQQQRVRRADSATTEDNLPLRTDDDFVGCARRRHAVQRNAHSPTLGPLALEEHPRDVAGGSHGQVWALVRDRVDKSPRSVGPHAPLVSAQLHSARAELLGAVVVIVRGEASLVARVDEDLAQRRRALRHGLRHVQLAAHAVVLRLAEVGIVLRPLEERQNVVEAPALAAVLVPPAVVVLGVAAHVLHVVEAGAPAHHLAARPVAAAFAELEARVRLRLRLVLPVQVRALQRAAAADAVDRLQVVLQAGLEQQHAAARVGGEAVRNDRAGGAAADHDVVVRLLERRARERGPADRQEAELRGRQVLGAEGLLLRRLLAVGIKHGRHCSRGRDRIATVLLEHRAEHGARRLRLERRRVRGREQREQRVERGHCRATEQPSEQPSEPPKSEQRRRTA